MPPIERNPMKKMAISESLQQKRPFFMSLLLDQTIGTWNCNLKNLTHDIGRVTSFLKAQLYTIATICKVHYLLVKQRTKFHSIKKTYFNIPQNKLVF